ncbi:MAG: hypothetical protein ABIG96_06895 [Candidatus Micrarchaeota archaeon]
MFDVDLEFEAASLVKRLKARKEGKLSRSDRSDTMVFAQLVAKGEERELKKAIENRLIIPSSKLSKRMRWKILRNGRRISRTYLIPMDTPYVHSYGIPVHDVRSQNYLMINNEDLEQGAWKGKGTAFMTEDVTYGVDEKTGKKLLLRGNLLFRSEEHSDERKLWGGGQVPTLMHAMESIQLIRDEIEVAKREGDPAFALAKKYGCEEPILIRPFGIFRQMQLPIAIDFDRFGNDDPVTPLNIGKKTRERLMKVGRDRAVEFMESFKARHFTAFKDKQRVIKVGLKEGGRILGIPKNFMKNLGMMGYTSPWNVRLWKVKKFAPVSREIALGHLNRFAASQGLIIHVLHNRLSLSGGSRKSGSVLTPQNIGIDLADYRAIYHDFDTIRPANHYDALTLPRELAFARSSIRDFANILGLSKPDVREAASIMTKIAKGARE